MILGNSNGANKGKKYFIRKRDLDNTEAIYEVEAAAFVRWFSENHKSLVRQIRAKHAYDDDVFNETYLRLHEAILYTGREIKDYASYFHRSYFTNNVQLSMSNNRYKELFENIDYNNCSLIDEYEDALDREETIQKQYNNVIDYVSTKYTDSYKLFMLNKVENIPYHILSKKLSIPYHIILREVSTIKKDLNENSHLINNPQNNNIMEVKTKKCGKCHIEKPESDFNKNASQKDGLQFYCKECQRKAANASYKKEPIVESYQPLVKKESKPTLENVLDIYSSEMLMKELYKRGYEGVLTYKAHINIAQV